jgi:replicative DNA helicase
MNDVPVAPEAEAAVLGAILLAGRIPPEVEQLLDVEDFYEPALGAVYGAALALVHDGKPCDHVSVLAELDPVTLRATGNGLRLHEFTASAPLGGMEWHAQIVAKTAKRRRHITAAQKIIQAAREDADNLDDFARAAVDSVPRGGASSVRPAWDALQGILDRDPQADVGGIPLGFHDLDGRINPLLPGAITTIAARSGVGKSTLAADILRNAAYRHGKKALYISIEMSEREVYGRVLSAEARIDYTKIRSHGPYTPAEEARMQEAAARIGNGNLAVADVDTLTLSDVHALIRDQKPDVVAIDFLGMMQFAKADRHDLAITETVYGLKRIAKAEQCHLIVLSQFNRGADHRTDKRPVAGDLRDSPALEQASHLMLLLHRPDLIDEDDRPGEVDVIVAKQRDGAAGFTVALAAQLHYSRFSSLAAEPKPMQAPVVDITEPQWHREAV